MKSFNITLPTSWAELSDAQLLMVYRLFYRDLSASEVKALCLIKRNLLKTLASQLFHYGSQYELLRSIKKTKKKEK